MLCRPAESDMTRDGIQLAERRGRFSFKLSGSKEWATGRAGRRSPRKRPPIAPKLKLQWSQKRLHQDNEAEEYNF